MKTTAGGRSTLLNLRQKQILLTMLTQSRSTRKSRTRSSMTDSKRDSPLRLKPRERDRDCSIRRLGIEQRPE